MYDYGNSTWIAALGSVGQKYLGYYQFAENIISLLLNPIGGAVASLVNFFIAAFNYLAPFSNGLFGNTSSYATLLSMGAVGSIFMPLSTAIMTALPGSINIYTFAIIGAGVLVVSACGFIYSKKNLTFQKQ